MVLIAVLSCLALQRFVNIGWRFQMPWFEFYLRRINPWIAKLNEWIMVLLIVAPVVLFLALLHFLFSQLLFGLFDLILSIVILFFCIDASDFRNKLAVYFDGLEKNDVQVVANAVTNFVEDVASNNTIAELNRAVTKAILLSAFEQLFAGLFWFVIFGIYGVTAYFLVGLLSKSVLKIDSNYIELVKLTAKIQDALDWIPSRLVGISYSLIGNFRKGFDYCYKHLWYGLAKGKKFAVDAGIAALEVDSDVTKVTFKENYAALDLIDRALIVWLTALFLILLGALI